MRVSSQSKKIRRTAVAFLLALASICLFSGCSAKDTDASADVSGQTVQTSTAQNRTSQNYILENYGLNIQVQSRHRMIVTETLTIHYDTQMDEITRVIPYEGYRYDPEKNEVVQYRMVLDQIQVDDASLTVKRDSGKAYLTIGPVASAEDDSSGGTQIYTLRYRLSCYQDNNTEIDQFFYNLLPYEWDGSISTANISITMPKEFESTGVALYRYSAGAWEQSEVSCTASGKTLSAYLKSDEIKQNKDLSIQITLPEGYFKHEKSLIPIQLFFYTLITLLTAGVAVLWWMFGRKRPAQKTDTVLKKHKLTALEDAYLLRKTLSVTDVTAFLTSWAESGMIRITQYAADDYVITCLSPLGKGAKNFEFTLYNALFGGDSKTLSVGAAAAIIRRILPKLKRQVAKNCTAICGGRLYTLESICVRLTGWIFSAAPIPIVLAVGGYVALDYSAKYLGLLAGAVLLVTHGLLLLLERYRKNMARAAQLLFGAIVLIAELVTLSGSIYFGVDSLAMNWQMIFALVMTLLLLGVALLSGRQSEGYHTQLSLLAAYKRYLRNPEWNDGEDISSAYYAQLSQAYVLRVGKLFSKKCDTVFLKPNDGFVFRDEGKKLAHTTGFYQAYLHFIAVMYRADPPAGQTLSTAGISGTEMAYQSEVPAPEKPEKWYQALLHLVIGWFGQIAVWANEGIDWVEIKWGQLKHKLSRKKEDQTDQEEN
jgi:hypothetical protein